MLIDLKQLLAGKTGRVEIDHEFPLDDPELPFDTAVEGVRYSGPARVRGEILDMGGCVSLSVKVSVDYDTECARCLAPLHRSLTVTLSRTLVEAGSLENTPEEDADDYLEYTDGMLDIDTPARRRLSCRCRRGSCTVRTARDFARSAARTSMRATAAA